jgi:4-hydroxybenzoate polyprenyltransferase
MKRWWIFIRERFAPATHVPMIASFTLANGCLGLAMLAMPVLSRNPEALHRLPLAMAVALAFFLRLRIFDEIKDYQTDLRVNPARPLARGLIRIAGAQRVIVGLCAFEILALSLLAPMLACSHLLAMGYSLLMYREFFIGSYLRPHLTTYAILHTFVSVLSAGTVVSVVTGVPFWGFSSSMWLLLLANWGYFNLFEFARKTFAPAEERANVESYSKVFTVVGAVALSLSQAIVPLLIVHHVLGAGLTQLDNSILVGLLAIVVAPALAFAIRPNTLAAKWFRGLVGIYLIFGYLALAATLAF